MEHARDPAVLDTLQALEAAIAVALQSIAVQEQEPAAHWQREPKAVAEGVHDP